VTRDDRTDRHGRFSHAADLPRSVARVQVHDTAAQNQRVRVHVEHPSHYRGVHSWLRSDREGVVRSVRSHLDGLDAEIVRVELEDDADLGLGEADLLGGEQSDRERDSPTALGRAGP